jgi:hypothetical protein
LLSWLSWTPHLGVVLSLRKGNETSRIHSIAWRHDLAVRRALESAGVIFIDENGDGPGVRLRKQSKEKSRK